MSVVDFSEMPETARLWIFASEASLDRAEIQALERHVNQFMTQWTAHKRELKTAWQLKHDRFIMVAVDESMMAASGCSIDAMVRCLRDFENTISKQIVGTHSLVFFRDPDDEIKSVDRLEFKSLVQQGEVTGDTIVFDNTITRLTDLKQGRWEVAMKDSWHSEAFARVVA